MAVSNETVTINDKASIVSRFQRAMLEEETVEVQFNNRTRLFFSEFMDHKPNLAESVGTDGELILEEPPYQHYSYLGKCSHLLIYPMSPAVGNAYIRSSGDLIVRFFHGTKAFEAQVHVSEKQSF